MSKWRGAMRADEHQKILDNDPDYQARTKLYDEARAKRKAILDADQAGLIQELAAVGYPVKSVYDLVNTNASYPEAIPVLIRHLSVPHDHAIKEGCARALTVKEARGVAVMPLLKALRQSVSKQEQEFRWCIVNALAIVGDQRCLDEFDHYLRSPEHEHLHATLKIVRKRCEKRKPPKV